MRENYQKKLEQMQRELLEMGMLCEEAIQKTYRLLASEQEREQLVKSIDALEREIDAKERRIEADCIQLFLQQQPVASDLRLISSALKMITDLERIGDHATDIAEILETGSIQVPVKEIELAKMAEIAMDMINHSVESYVEKDLDMARAVIDRDDELDALFVDVRKEISRCSAEGIYTNDQTLDLLMIAKYYERLGDHATNVAEWVEFSLTGKHRSGKEVNDVFAVLQ
ncbi:MAG: phosphate signaling complex protein PhoU [Lachnospiraceae bacterium]|nr:phosphate signaling complex protein PhoU [Lachnospiraceae bacterium]